uniref:Putative terpene synthase 4 n=1 Tax=Eremophila drummondii TaxID=2652523 RepID=A0A6G9KU26_9LAMI|nr:putative terpene synthase 4 [Eremophila drummondii]
MDLKYQSVLVSRPLAKFHPNVWGTRFLSFIPKSNAETQAEEQLVEGLKEGIKRELKETSNDYMRQLRTVDAIQRLGIEYHFEEEVDQTLESIFAKYHDLCKENHDIHSTSLSFRLLRQHGYRVSCEIFEKFKDVEGDFMVPDPPDVMGQLEFYEATHLRIRGEDVLDHGFLFSKKYLESILPSLSNPLAEQVHHALKECSNRRGIPRLEARRYISIYGQYASHHQGLLKLAKSDFNRLQSLHKEELSKLCRWWRDLEVPTKLSYARDRLVETYFWDLGVYFEPKYAVARKILTKAQAIISLIDDTYDAYGTFEELEIFTEAIERWSFSCLNQLPNNMKIVYKALLELFEEIAEEMDKLGTSYRVSYGKEAVKYLCRAYFAEAKWREERYKPATEEYMNLTIKSCGYTTLIIISFLGIDKHIASKEAFDWVFSEPDIVRAALKINRLRDDIVGEEFEQRDHIPSSVHCYMNEHKVPKHEAIDELNNQVEEEWKVMNEGFLRPTKIPAPLLIRIINFARVIGVLYKKRDWYTNVGPEMKSFIQQLFIDPVSED